MRSLDLHSAIHWWAAEHDDEGIDGNVSGLLFFLFQLLETLHYAAGEFPSQWAPVQHAGVSQGGRHGLTINLEIGPKDFHAFRAAVGVVGDMYCIAKRLEAARTADAAPVILRLREALEPFRELRNFFAHLDDHVTNLDQHGITGELQTPVGIHYPPESIGNFHLVISGNTVNFTRNAKAHHVVLDRQSLGTVFVAGRDLYSLITSHKIHATTYAPAEEKFPPLN
jgi:hypothetical protein